MNSSTCTVLAVFCFMLVFISVNGQRAEPKLHNAPPRISRKQPPRPPGSVGQQKRPPAPSSHTDPRFNHNIGVKAFPSYASNFGTFHTSNDKSKLHNSNAPPRTSRKQPPRPPGSVGQQKRPLPPSHTNPRYNHNIGVNAVPSYASNFGTFHTSNDDPRLHYGNKPPQNRPTGRSSQNNPTGSVGQQPLPSYGYHNLRPNANSDLGPMYNRKDDPRLQYGNKPPQNRPTGRPSQKNPTGSVGQQPLPSYGYHNLRPNANRDLGPMYSSRDHPKNIPPQSSQNHRPIRPSLNNYDPRNFNEMEVNYRPNANSAMGPKFIRDVPKQLNAWPTQPPLNYYDPRDIHKKDVNYNLQRLANKDLGSIRNSRGELIKLKVKKNPFNFEYEEKNIGSLLQMDMSFKLTSNVHRGFVFIRSSLRQDNPEKIIEIRRPNLSDETDKVANIQWYVTKEHVYIDVELHNKSGVCLYKRISQGKMLDQRLSTSDLKYPNSPNCLSGNICEIEVDFMKECRGEEITENSYCNIILIVSLSIFATVLIVFAIVAFFKRCWAKRDVKDLLQVPQLLPSSPPFYVNLLFRKECQEIIDDLEQNQYELID